MKTMPILIICLLCLMFTAPAFAIDSDYGHVEYYDTFRIAAAEQQKMDNRVVTDQKGQRAAIIPKATKQENVEQQQMKNGEEKDISKN